MRVMVRATGSALRFRVTDSGFPVSGFGSRDRVSGFKVNGLRLGFNTGIFRD